MAGEPNLDIYKFSIDIAYEDINKYGAFSVI